MFLLRDQYDINTVDKELYTMKFSFIIPVYNVVQYLDECIQSVLRQSYKDYEIVLIDDGSMDGSETLCDKYANEYEQIRVIHQKNAGVSVARNVGIQAASGEYFIFIDSDDVWIGDQLGLLAEKIKEEPDIIAFEYQNFYEIKDLSQKKSAFSLPEISRRCNGEKFLRIILRTAVERSEFYQWNPWSYCYKKSFFEKNNFQYPVGRTSEDLSLTYQIILSAQQIIAVHEVVYGYRKSVMTAITKTHNYRNIADRLAACIQNMTDVKNNDNISPKLKKLLWDHFSEQYFIVLTMTDLPATKAQRKKIMKKLKENVWISKCSLRKNEQIIARLIEIFGLPFVCALLHVRRKIVYHGQFKRAKE